MRTAGILLPVTSLPSPYGIGTLGRSAYDFVDFLSAAGQRYWQILPIGPTGYGDSPYQSFSAMAGNPYWVDLDMLAEQGLLTPEEIGQRWGSSRTSIDYGLLFKKRFQVLGLAAQRQDTTAPAYRSFCKKQKYWLEDYALFMAIKEEFKHVSFTLWPEDLRTRRPHALQLARQRLAHRVEFWRIVQYFFFTQWNSLKSYANKQGVGFIGDIPIYISPDSSELWAQPELFQTRPDGTPSAVAGVPPDAFSADGQLWGNPLYNWPYHKQTGYAWWLQRLRASAELYDVTRIDHFRGFAGYYAIPYGAKNARKGVWRKGPGLGFVKAVQKALPNMGIIAEDLGFLTPDVFALLKASGYPGMKILQFAFDSREESDYLPHNYPHHTVAYTGTHDNATTEQWAHTALPQDIAYARSYLGLDARQSLTDGLVRAALASVADTAVIPLQDWLRLGAKARINTPSTLGGNWCWRLLPGQFSTPLALHIRGCTRLYGRLSPFEKKKEQKAAREAQALLKKQAAKGKKAKT